MRTYMGAKIEEKVQYVLAQKQSRLHECHWPGCKSQVPPALWGCKIHWYMLPRDLRAAIWASYVPGQEVTQTPSAKYIEVAKKVQAWIAKFEGDSE